MTFRLPIVISRAKQLIRQEMIQKLEKEIEKFDRLSRTEKQPKKKFEYYQQAQELKIHNNYGTIVSICNDF